MKPGRDEAGDGSGLPQIDLAAWIGPDSAFAGLRARDKQQAIVQLAVGLARRRGLDDRMVIDALLAREHLGSTGLGWGVALPHARIPGLDRICGAIASLEAPIEFAALDDNPVDLVCLLLAPAGAGAGHLHALAAISRRLRDPVATRAMRAATSAAGLHAALVDDV